MGNAEKGLDLRVALDGTEPEIWRSLRVPADIPLPALHRVIQAAFGWENRHLHHFAVRDTAGEACFLAGDESTAVELGFERAADFTLDQLVGPQTKVLEYEYDFGDSWSHTITVTGLALAQHGQFVCTGGARRGPLEDSGGIGGYHEKCLILADPKHPDYEEIADWYAAVAPDDPQRFDPERFSVDEVNQRLERLARVLDDREPTVEEKAAVVRPVQWLLQSVGADGLELTKDGYLKPAVVEEAMGALDWAHRWYGKFNRESQTLPILDLRENCQRWKLLRKYKGRLVRTPAGRRTADDVAALWSHLVDALAHPASTAEGLLTEAMVGWMIEDNMPTYDVRDGALAGLLNYKGFRMQDGSEVSADAVGYMANEIGRTLHCLNIPESEGLLPTTSRCRLPR